MQKAPTTEQIRSDIDSGRTGEKVDYGDPAAAPLGTDAEAAGHAPSRRERRLANDIPKRPAPVNTPGPVTFFVAVTILIIIASLAAGWWAMGGQGS